MAVKDEENPPAQSSEDQSQRKTDTRCDWFEDKVCKALRIKSDKWKKMVYSNENW